MRPLGTADAIGRGLGRLLFWDRGRPRPHRWWRQLLSVQVNIIHHRSRWRAHFAGEGARAPKKEFGALHWLACGNGAPLDGL